MPGHRRDDGDMWTRISLVLMAVVCTAVLTGFLLAGSYYVGRTMADLVASVVPEK